MILQEFSGRVKGLKVDPVDTTGAGDAFVAGILSQLASDDSLFQVSVSAIYFIIVSFIFLVSKLCCRISAYYMLNNSQLLISLTTPSLWT